MKKREYAEWNDFWWEKGGDFDAKRVALIGDSITRGYYASVKEHFASEGILVDRFCGSHTAGDQVFEPEIEYILGAANDYRYQVIHFNNGLHGGCNDTRVDLADYERGMTAAVEAIRRLQPQAKLILATSTNMVKKGKAEDDFDAEFNDFVLERNEFIRAYAKENGYFLDDLYEAVAWKPEYPHSDGVHFSPAGYQKLASCVIGAISENL